jgi:phage terminase large subunit
MLAPSGTLQLETPEVFVPALDPARYVGLYGGRGSGKSYFMADKLIERAIMRPTRWMCVRETQVSLKQSVKQLLMQEIDRLNVGRYFKERTSHIETPGGEFVFTGMKNHNSESIKSYQGFHGAWIEEAQTFSQRSLELIRPTIREDDSEIWMTWNPNLPTDPVDVFMRQQRPKNSILVKANFYDNPFFPEVLREDLEYDKRRDYERYKHVWLGGYNTRSDARVFKNWRVGDIEDFRPNTRTYFYLGADWGYSIDPSVLISCYVEGRTLFIVAEAYKVGCEIDYIEKLFIDAIPYAKQYMCTADSARPETISYLRRNHGFSRMRAAKKGPNSIQEGIEFLRKYDIVVHPDCVHTIDELSNYSYDQDKLTQAVLPKLLDKKNHVIDALRYAVEPLRRGRIGMF